MGKLFPIFFIAMVQAIAILLVGNHGSLSLITKSGNNEAGSVNAMYFWATRALSSFLDNSPRNVVFFNAAGGNAQELMGPFALITVFFQIGYSVLKNGVAEIKINTLSQFSCAKSRNNP